MWKSRIDKLPPTQFFADLIQHLRNLYPGATIDDSLVRTMSEVWIAEWRAGQSAQDTAKATCSCDGRAIVPSAGAGRDLGKRLARAPKGAKRGDFIAPAELREVSPLAAARREAEKYSQAFDRVRAATMTLLQAKGWTPSKGLKLQRLRQVLHDLKAKHDAAVKKYEEVRRSRKESQQPTLYEKPLGALGLSLRPDELPEPHRPSRRSHRRNQGHEKSRSHQKSRSRRRNPSHRKSRSRRKHRRRKRRTASRQAILTATARKNRPQQRPSP